MSIRDLERRSFLKLAAGGVMGALLARSFGGSLAQAGAGDALAPLPAARPGAKATACIVLWLNGGPSHVDTFDPKPGRATGGPFKAIQTRAPGMMLSEHLPMLADRADRIAVVRNMSSREGNHQRAQYLLRTGYPPSGTVDYPSIGGWASSRLGDPNDDLPAFVSIGGASIGAGFLGVQNGPFVVQKAGGVPANVGYAPGVDDARFGRRIAGLEMLESRFDGETRDTMVDGRRAVYAKAVRMMHSPRIQSFDVSSEPMAVRAAYGDTDFGRGCLLARKLVETGVKFIEVVLDGWDTHRDNFGRTTKLMGTLDPAMSTLLRELEERNLLGSTLVACMGEFGRTPKINGNDGRDHHPQAWSAVLAGGGVRGGVVHGQTDDDGDKVIGPPESVPDLVATMATQLGMDPDDTERTPIGRPISLTDHGAPIRAILG